MKFLGIGLPKTGTTTFGHCFVEAGLSKAPYDMQFFQEVANGDQSRLKQKIGEYDCFEDWPWPLLYRQVNEEISDVRFILTLRKDAETWLQSLQKHTDRNPNNKSRELRKNVFGFTDPWENSDDYKEFYENHSKQVLHYFRNQPNRLLVVCWENMDGWNDLAPFLNLEALPQTPIPQLNSSSLRPVNKHRIGEILRRIQKKF